MDYAISVLKERLAERQILLASKYWDWDTEYIIQKDIIELKKAIDELGKLTIK